MGDKKTFIDTTATEGSVDYKYLAKAIRQHLAANGGIICDDKEDADYILEVRTGAVGTDRSDLLLVGVPPMTIPAIPGSQYTATTLPEIPIVKRTKEVGVAKIAVFAYNQHTGRPLWASGNTEEKSTANQLWIAGAGPLQRGTIYKETTFADHSMPSFMTKDEDKQKVSFADRANYFKEIAGEPKLKDKNPAPPVPVLPPVQPAPVEPQVADPWLALPQ
jgi:hypothetical protein